MTPRRVLVLTPTTFGYEQRITDALRRAGHTVDWLDERVANGTLAKVLTRLGLLRWVPGVLARHERRVAERLHAHGADVLLLINPETLVGPALARIRAAFPDLEIVVYRWDGSANKPFDVADADHADAVYSFDPADCARWPELSHLPLFHSYTAPPTAGAPAANPTVDFSFVGTCRAERIRTLARIERVARSQGRTTQIRLVSPSGLHHLVYRALAQRHGFHGSLTRRGIDYSAYCALVAASRCVIDLPHPDQTGLTMRTLETVFAGIPLLTANPSVTQYDFYPSSAVFLLDQESPVLPPQHDLVPTVPTAFFDAYSIDAWVATLLGGRAD